MKKLLCFLACFCGFSLVADENVTNHQRETLVVDTRRVIDPSKCFCSLSDDVKVLALCQACQNIKSSVFMDCPTPDLNKIDEKGDCLTPVFDRENFRFRLDIPRRSQLRDACPTPDLNKNHERRIYQRECPTPDLNKNREVRDCPTPKLDDEMRDCPTPKL